MCRQCSSPMQLQSSLLSPQNPVSRIQFKSSDVLPFSMHVSHKIARKSVRRSAWQKDAEYEIVNSMFPAAGHACAMVVQDAHPSSSTLAPRRRVRKTGPQVPHNRNNFKHTRERNRPLAATTDPLRITRLLRRVNS